MAAIPVPVHFDGHNINIITEDSPSTCKNRVKGINFGSSAPKQQKKKRNGKQQIVNKQGPNSGSIAASSEGDLSPSSNKENIELNDNETSNVLSPTSATTDKSNTDNNSPPSPAPGAEPGDNVMGKDDTKTSNDGVESSGSITTTSLKPIELNAANLAKNPFTKRSNNNNNNNPTTTNTNQPEVAKEANSLSPAPITSTETTKKPASTLNPDAPPVTVPGLPAPPKQFKMQPAPKNNGTLKQRKSPRLPVPFNPNQSFEGHRNTNNFNFGNVPPPNNGGFNPVPSAMAQSAVIDTGAQALVTPNQSIQQFQQNMMLDPNEFGSHDDIGNALEDEDGDENGGKDRQNLYKTELCREWSTSGWCYYNKRCSFAHGLQELRPVFRSKKWRTKRCRNWHTTGYCPYEHRCQFLHDQSPPRRISDYATANARALIAAQQRMQPLYFHYQVDCDRNESGDEQGDDENNTNNTKPTRHQGLLSPADINPNTPSIGPRLKRRGYNVTAPTGTSAVPNDDNSNQNVRNSPLPTLSDTASSHKTRKVRMIPANTKSKKVKHPTLPIPSISTDKNEGGSRGIFDKQNAPRTPASDASENDTDDEATSFRINGKTNNNATSQLKPGPVTATTGLSSITATKTEKKKKKKDTVITPFNPVQPYQAPQYEIAAQQLGIYDPRTTQLLPQTVPVQAHGLQHAAAGLGGVINTTVVPGMGHLPISAAPQPMFQGLPPSIDPTLYLSLTPSPPLSPAIAPNVAPAAVAANPATVIPQNPAAQQLLQQQQQALTARSLAVHQVAPVPGPDPARIGTQHGQVPEITMMTPSPPLPITMDPMSQHQQAQIALKQQQETLQLLQNKVHAVGQQQQQPNPQLLLQRALNNKSATPVPPIGGDLLQSLLPTHDTNEDTKTKRKIPGLPPPPLPVPNIVNLSPAPLGNDNEVETKESGDGQTFNHNKPATKEEETKEEEPSGFRSKSKDNPKTLSSSVPNTTNKKPTESVKNLPPIPPIPPPLALQTSINSVVTGAVAAAVTPTAAGFVPMTPTLIDGTNPGMFGFPASATAATTAQKAATTATATATVPTTAVPTITGVVPTTLIPSIPQQTYAHATTGAAHPGFVPVDVTYAQQAHAHAHAYAAAQAHARVPGVHGVPTYTVPTHHIPSQEHVAYAPVGGHQVPIAHGHLPAHYGVQQIPIQPQMGYAAQAFYPPSPHYQEVPHQQYTTHYTEIPPRHHYQ